MTIGERIHFFRILRGMTQKYLGTLIGFPEKSADVRLAQYETGIRTPKSDITYALANALDVSPQALDIPDIDSDIGLMHTFFALEDIYGLTIAEKDGNLFLHIDNDRVSDSVELLQMLTAWQAQSAKLHSGEFTKDDYDNWRYHYPKFDDTRLWAKIPSEELSDAMTENFKDRWKSDE